MVLRCFKPTLVIKHCKYQYFWPFLEQKSLPHEGPFCYFMIFYGIYWYTGIIFPKSQWSQCSASIENTFFLIACGPVLTRQATQLPSFFDIQPTPSFTKKLLLDLQGEVLLQLLLQLLGQLLWKLALQLLGLLGHLLCCLLTLLQLLLDLRGPQLQGWNISSWSIYWGWYRDLCAPTTSHNYDLTGRTSMDLPGKVVL